jgi:hypothetical protein
MDEGRPSLRDWDEGRGAAALYRIRRREFIVTWKSTGCGRVGAGSRRADGLCSENGERVPGVVMCAHGGEGTIPSFSAHAFMSLTLLLTILPFWWGISVLI